MHRHWNSTSNRKSSISFSLRLSALRTPALPAGSRGRSQVRPPIAVPDWHWGYRSHETNIISKHPFRSFSRRHFKKQAQGPRIQTFVHKRALAFGLQDKPHPSSLRTSFLQKLLSDSQDPATVRTQVLYQNRAGFSARRSSAPSHQNHSQKQLSEFYESLQWSNRPEISKPRSIGDRYPGCRLRRSGDRYPAIRCTWRGPLEVPAFQPGRPGVEGLPDHPGLYPAQ